MYILWLQRKKNCYVQPDQLAKRVSNLLFKTSLKLRPDRVNLNNIKFNKTKTKSNQSILQRKKRNVSDRWNKMIGISRYVYRVKQLNNSWISSRNKIIAIGVSYFEGVEWWFWSVLCVHRLWMINTNDNHYNTLQILMIIIIIHYSLCLRVSILCQVISASCWSAWSSPPSSSSSSGPSSNTSRDTQ